MSVFDNVPRTDSSVLNRNESRYHFLNRIEGPFWERTRQLIEHWFSLYPAGPDRDELLQRIRGGDAEHAAALWELYLHEVLRRSGWGLTPHPILPNVRTHPDFLARHGSATMLVEATTIGIDIAETARRNRLDSLLSALDEVGNPNYYIWGHWESQGAASPQRPPLRAKAEAWLGSLDLESTRALAAGGDLEKLPNTVIEPGPGWRFRLYALPVREGAQRVTGPHSFGIEGDVRTEWVDKASPLLRTLKLKTSKYGAIDQPYLIAIQDLSDWPPDDVDHGKALYGTTSAFRDRATGCEYGARREPDGFWTDPRHRGSHVSAVLLCWHFKPWAIAREQPTLWLNPQPVHPMPDLASLPWHRRALSENKLDVAASSAVVEPWRYFDLPNDWPGPENPFRRTRAPTGPSSTPT